jgi:hypothetical protein
MKLAMIYTIFSSHFLSWFTLIHFNGHVVCRPMAQTVSCRPVTLEARVSPRVGFVVNEVALG